MTTGNHNTIMSSVIYVPLTAGAKYLGLEYLPALVTKAQEMCLSLVPVECKTIVIVARILARSLLPNGA